MTSEAPVALEPCPFCGANLEQGESLVSHIWFHPGTITDGKCLLSGKGFYGTDLELWNTRIASHSDLVEALRAALEWMEGMRASGDAGNWDWADDDVYTQARAILTKSEHPMDKTCGWQA